MFELSALFHVYRIIKLNETIRIVYAHLKELWNKYNYIHSQEIDVIEHKTYLIGANTKDMKIVITISQDGTLRIWDRTKRKQMLSCTDATGLRDNNGLLRMGYIS